jgi:hypothetical protein
MTIKLNHTIIPARDKEAAAGLFAQLFGFSFEGEGRAVRETTARDKDEGSATKEGAETRISGPAIDEGDEKASLLSLIILPLSSGSDEEALIRVQSLRNAMQREKESALRLRAHMLLGAQ